MSSQNVKWKKSNEENHNMGETTVIQRFTGKKNKEKQKRKVFGSSTSHSYSMY